MTRPHKAARPWSLPGAFDVRRGDVAAFVGGGGKTAAMFRLAEALAEQRPGGCRVVTTCTTLMGREQSALAPRHLVLADGVELWGQLASALGIHSHVLVTGPPTENGLKWRGVSPGWVAQAASQPAVDVVLVEADGARKLPLKAPAAHEPVVPPCTTVLVPVAGVDAIGRAVQEVAHRPEQVSALTGLAPGELITPEAVAVVLGHPAGGLKGRPEAARTRVLINKADTQAALARARQVASHLLQESGTEVQAVIIGAVGTPRPVREVRRKVAAVVLAAGSSVRMPGDVPKLLLHWECSTVVRRVVETLSGCPVQPVLVVTGHRAEQVRRELAGTCAQTVHNPGYAAGEMLSSLQTGIRALPAGVSGCLVVLGDQPWLELDVVGAVLDGYASGPAGIVAPTFGGKRGHPVLIDRRHWSELLRLEPGLAPRHLLQRHPAHVHLIPVGSDSVLRDMNTWDDYQRALGRGVGGST